MKLNNVLILLGVSAALPLAAAELEVSESAVEFALILMQHSPQALSNLHSIPVCGQMCIFEPSYRDTYAPKCSHYSGSERFACFCKSHAYQYKLDRCFKRQCSREKRKAVILLFIVSLELII